MTVFLAQPASKRIRCARLALHAETLRLWSLTASSAHHSHRNPCSGDEPCGPKTEETCP